MVQGMGGQSVLDKYSMYQVLPIVLYRVLFVNEFAFQWIANPQLSKIWGEGDIVNTGNTCNINILLDIIDKYY